MRTRLDARTLRLHGAAPRRTLHAGRRRPRFSLCLFNVYGRSLPQASSRDWLSSSRVLRTKGGGCYASRCDQEREASIRKDQEERQEVRALRRPSRGSCGPHRDEEAAAEGQGQDEDVERPYTQVRQEVLGSEVDNPREESGRRSQGRTEDCASPLEEELNSLVGSSKT